MTGKTDSPALASFSKLSNYPLNALPQEESKASRHTLSQVSHLSQTQGEILEFMDRGLAYPLKDIADGFGFSDEEAKGQLESLYENEFVEKKPGQDGKTFYRKPDGEDISQTKDTTRPVQSVPSVPNKEKD